MSNNPKLRDWQGYLPTPLPSGFTIPSEGKFLLPVCTDARRLNLMLQALQEWKQYDDFPEKYIYDHMIDVLEALAFINNVFDACGGLMLQMRIEPGENGECRLNLYSITGSGESQTETLLSGVNLNQCQPELTASAQATTLEPNEPATASVEVVEGELQFDFGIPKGEKGDNAPIPEFHFSQPTDDIIYLQIDTDGSGGYDVQSPNIKGAKGEDGEGIDSVEVTTLAAGSNATASLTDGVLSLGIPRGEDGENLTPIESVQVTTLAAGANATASLTDGVLSLGIPRGNTGATGQQGQQGLQGLQGLPGQDGEDCDCGGGTPPEPSEARPLENVCGGVVGLVDWLISRGSSDMASAKLVASGVETFFGAFLDVVTLGMGDVTPVAAFSDIIFAGVQASYDAILNQYANSEFQEEIKCNLYCLIKNSGQTGFTEEIYNQWKQTIPNWPVSGLTSPNGLFTFGGFGDQIEHLYNYNHLNKRYWVYAQDSSSVCEGLCTDCQSNEWEYTFEGQELYDYWELFDPASGYAGIWESTEFKWHLGVVSNPDTEVGGFLHRIALQLKTPLTTPANISTIVVAFTPYSPNVGGYSKWYADNQDWALDPIKYIEYGQDSAEYTIEKSFTRIRFDIAADANYPGEPSAYIRPIQSITLSGMGANPFV